MVVQVKNTNTGGPTGQFQRPGGARFEPGSGTHAIMANRNSAITEDVIPTYAIEPVAARRGSHALISGGAAPGELVLGTDISVQPRTNDAWIAGLNDAEHGRNTEDLYAGMRVPAWFPSYPMGTGVEDRS